MTDTSFLNWPFFEDRHRELHESLEQWCKKNLPVNHNDVDEACKNLVQNLGKNGFLKHSAINPADPGPLDVRSICLIREVLARYDGLADFAFAMQGLGTGALSLFGSPAQQQVLQETRKGNMISAFALSEPKSGSDVANIETTARLEDDTYTLNGEKIWISNGGIADIYVVFARTGEAPGAKGLSAFLVPAQTEGLVIAERLETIAPHPLARIEFHNAAIPKENLIGVPGQGFAIAMAVLDVFRSSVGAAALGFARRAMDEAIKRSTTRELFGASMSQLQMVQGHIADMAVKVDASALLIYRAAWTKDMGTPRITREAAMAKLFATDMAQEVIDASVQIHGADGVRKGHIVEQLYREIRALRIYEGASDVQKTIIARQTLNGAK